ncbi:mRNA export factor elf1 [Verticillium alfalfae VaMs.102]|uniref:mRNA export factor elf1 n=1 Tax=Verticillium alfalfae (strain VaMs.102 / ATCC MYA-4576 / FGSC 10136) TaxID=526221 RepID=C9S9S6_VERA1|nr:mRNA export factor elf1 [Verticillium alfalfae VaMs.102]EEY16139.1 mRNA export factor elf1 [Verticillium alfalfae VaMs.102]
MTMVSKAAGPAPSQQDVSAFITTIFTAQTSNQSIEASYGLCELLLNSVGSQGLESYGVLAEIKKAAADKKSGLRRESAQNLLGALFERFPAKQPTSETIFLLRNGGIVNVALDALADKGTVVRDAAQYGLDALFAHLSPEALVVGLLPALSAYLSKSTGKWQGTVGAYKLLQKMADKAKLIVGSTKEQAAEGDVLRDSFGTKLAGLIPIVEAGMHDLKAEVGKQAVQAMNSLTNLLEGGNYVAEQIAEDVNHRHVDRVSARISPYFQTFTEASATIADAVQQYYVEEDARKFGVPEREDDGETEIVNADFSLAYGGMLLLSHTNLRLLKGHRYGLCGRNGAGKSTLMRSIANGKLEGFPPQDVLRTCYFDRVPRLWIPRHVTTDIYHYEPGKKLGHYKGNLAAFVEVKPEAKSYYTLSASQVQFKFPPPGILSGVKSQTRAIIRMSNVSYAYPGSDKPSLSEVSCQLSLSSRVAIIGPNGAGKSTLIKLLTGETIPTTGKVEKHPNLRIGYIKQHALEHVEMHLEKTPNQYLQWRYANGDDREVFLKQTRILSDKDREQMDKMIDLGDGKGGRQLEALVGRQKWKKTFQYEVKWRNWLPKNNSQVSRETLSEWGFDKLVQEFDDHEASREGLGYRELQPSVISKHFLDLGLDPEIANHNEIGSLSGGQKVKVVIAGAMWNNPHLLVLDEPTNFLDRDSLGGLAVAIRDFKGGVILISHNEEFVGALCSEQWLVNDGRVAHRGTAAVSLDRFEDSSRPGSGPYLGRRLDGGQLGHVLGCQLGHRRQWRPQVQGQEEAQEDQEGDQGAGGPSSPPPH